MERTDTRKSIQIESAKTGGFLESPFVNFLDEMSSRFYFWFDRNVIVRGGYDINDDNGFIINSLAHGVFKLRKAAPALKELKEAGYLSTPGFTRLGYEYLRSFLDDGRIQQFTDNDGNKYCALNLHLANPSVASAVEHIAAIDSQIEVVLGNCSKGYLPHEAGNPNIHVCEYRVKSNCFYNGNSNFIPPKGSPFEICAQRPCLVGKLHQDLSPSHAKPIIARSGCNFNTILGGYQTFREIPGFFDMNTDKGSPKFIIWGTCRFSIPYLIQAARMFPNVQGIAIAYANGCQTLGDRAIRLRGERRDKHITRFLGSEPIDNNPISRLIENRTE